MKNTKNLGFLGAMAVAGIIAGASVYADNSGATNGSANLSRHEHMKEVAEACAKANDVTLPAQGAGQKMSSSDQAKMKSCFAQFKQKMEACAQDAGVPNLGPHNWKNLTDAQKTAVQQCKNQTIAQVGSASS